MAPPIYRFGEFQLDPARHELWRGEEGLSLRIKVFDCIVYLIENRDRAIGRDELIEAVWGDVNLTDNALLQVVRQARHALGDTGDDQNVIQTVRGFGYRWAAPVEMELVEAPEAEAVTPQNAVPEEGSRWRGTQKWPWVVPAALVVGALIFGAYLWLDGDPVDVDGATVPIREGDIALLLPVVVEGKDPPSWVRLGAMDLITKRLRDAGQPMVSSDNVIALSRGFSPEPTAEELGVLSTTTGARLVLGAHARANDSRWRVSLRTLRGTEPSLSALGEAEDVIEAARIAADHMALSLGRKPAPEPEAEPGLALLVQQITAAMLAEQTDLVRELIEAADPDLRAHPEIRFQRARVDHYGYEFDAAEATFQSLLDDQTVDGDSVWRARILNALGVLRSARGDYDAAERLYGEAVELLMRENNLDRLGIVLNNFGILALWRGDLEGARERLARARRPLESTGDVGALASLDATLGVVESVRDRWGDALNYYESAAERHRALHNLGAELYDRANVIRAHLSLLDPEAAKTAGLRLTELLAHVDHPRRIGYAKVTQAHLLRARGRLLAAEELLNEVLSTTEAHDDLWHIRLEVLLIRAMHAAQVGGSAEAARLAAEVLGAGPHDYLPVAEGIGLAWLILVRAELALGRIAEAAEATAAMTGWAKGCEAPTSKIYAALARAELAAVQGRIGAARTAFEQAFAHADAGYAPLRLLEVAQAYVPWLLTDGPHKTADHERAVVVADRVARFADRDYGAALLQVRLYHTIGPPSAWRAALDRARSLAGERQVPQELLLPPTPARS